MSQVKLSWTAPADNVEVAGYLVERQDPGSTSFVQVGTSTGTRYNVSVRVQGLNRSKTSGAILLRTVRFASVSWPFSRSLMFK